ncbi:MAG: phospholipase D-like domain-containing protein [Nitrospiraceae bacterium]|nr:phospholipase D-like domain-containing protein [Nitrospiraceae bacterium]
MAFEGVIKEGVRGFHREEIERIYRDRFIGGNLVELLWKGEDTFRRIFDAVKSAKKSICLEFYIYRNDDTGREMAGILKAKAREGVKVYVLYDHFGSFGTPRKFWKDLRSAGVNVGASYVFKIDSPFKYVHRDHRKLIIIDGEAAFTGGLNMANEYSGFHIRHKKGWRDTGVLIRGPVAAYLLETFRKAWRLWGKGEMAIGAAAVKPHGPLSVMPVFAGFGKGRRKLRRLLYYSINHAEESILITTAYFSPSWRMLETIESAARRGVKVKLLLPGNSDVPAAKYAAMASYERLLRAGVEIYHYFGQVLHAKNYVFDRGWSIVGSANLDFQSLRWNDEGNVGILDEEFAGMLAEVFNEDLKLSDRVTPEQWSKRPFQMKIKEKFFSLFRTRL